MDRIAPFIRRWFTPARTVIALLLVAMAGWVGVAPLINPPVSAVPPHRPASATNAQITTTNSTSGSSLLSKGADTLCSENDTGPGEPEALTDGKFGNWGFWQLGTTTMPGWCAIHLNARVSKVLFVWYSDYSFDFTDTTNLAPQNYDLAVSANSTDGSDGTWKTVVSVRGNHARAREHLLGFEGMSWVRMTVLAGQPQPTQPFVRIDELEVFDAQALGNNTFFFSGDSITAMGYSRYPDAVPSFGDDMARCAPQHYPLMLDGGMGGQTSDGAVQELASWQAMLPDVHYWLLEWGTNDALNDVAPAAFRANLQMLVTAILQRGDVPFLAHIPYATYHHLPGLVAEIQRLNQVIDEVSTANNLIPGPDMFALFHAHPEYLLPDGLHPTGTGAIAMNALWFQVLRSHLGLGNCPG